MLINTSLDCRKYGSFSIVTEIDYLALLEDFIPLENV